ncbi:MAG: hypothetical protein ACREH9_01530 [Pseudomonadota bacterium]
MKRAFRFALLIGFGALALSAQEHESPYTIYWTWANFALLAGGLGYLIGKYAPGFFASRTEQIRRGIDEAAKLKQEAEASVAAMERRMSTLEAEIENLRREARSEMQAGGERVRDETAQQVAKIQKQTEQEVVALSSRARQELKKYAARLALDLAAGRIRARMTRETEDALVGGFVRDLERYIEQQGSRN